MEEELKKLLLQTQKEGFEQCVNCIRDISKATESIDIHYRLEALIACLEDLKNGIYGE
jgi:hypothetical protein